MRLYRLAVEILQLLILMALAAVLILAAGCAPSQMGAVMPKVSQVAATAPALALQVDDVYAFLVAQKAVPDHRE